jgi:GMP synthase (glutamine-hydrolysing)
MILIVDLCFKPASLSRYEFVDPIAGIVRRAGSECEVVHFTDRINKPLLGICAGMQVVAAVFGGGIVPQPKIGLEKIDITRETDLLGPPREIEGYHLHNFGVTLPPGFGLVAVAGRPGSIEAFRHSERQIYGIIFHPEVRNRWIVERFVDLR